VTGPPACACGSSFAPANPGLFAKRNYRAGTSDFFKYSAVSALLAAIISLTLRFRSDAERLPGRNRADFLSRSVASFLGPRHPSRTERIPLAFLSDGTILTDRRDMDFLPVRFSGVA